MTWKDSLSTHIWIFNVGRGNSTFIRTGLNQGFFIDMGKSGDFDPAEFLEENMVPYLDKYKGHAIAQAVLSHPHMDHILQCERLESGHLYPSLLTLPNDREEGEEFDWDRLEVTDQNEGLVDSYKALYKGRKPPLQTISFNSDRTVPSLEYGVYYIRPPQCGVLHPSSDHM